MIDCADWDAWYNKMPGADDEILHVAGSCELPSSSFELKLDLGNEGPTDDPKVVVLQLTVVRPPAGDDRLDTRSVSWQDTMPGIAQVRIQGETEASINVRDIY